MKKKLDKQITKKDNRIMKHKGCGGLILTKIKKAFADRPTFVRGDATDQQRLFFMVNYEN